MMIRKLLMGTTLALLPVQVLAYYTPEEVLSNFYLPPTAREAAERTLQQTVTSNERRQYVQSQLPYMQEKPAAPEEQQVTEGNGGETNGTTGDATPLQGISDEDLALLRAVKLLDSRESRLLSRVQAHQTNMQYYGDSRLHGGAPPLPDTGAGGILAAITMLGAVVWTIRIVKNANRVISDQ